MAAENTKGLSVAILVLGVIAIVLSFVAHATRIKADAVTTSPDGSCNYPRSPAVGLGIVAAFFLLTEQIVVSTGVGCFCCGGIRCPSNCGGITAIVLFVLSWVTFVIAFTNLIYSSIINSANFMSNVYSNNKSGKLTTECPMNASLFFGAAIWSIITVALGLISYITFKAKVDNQSIQTSTYLANDPGVAMGVPSTQAKDNI